MHWKIFFIVVFLFIPTTFIGAASNSIKKSTLTQFNLELKIKEQSYNISQKEINNWIILKTHLIYSPGYSSEIENIFIYSNKKYILCDLIFTEEKKYNLKKISASQANLKLIGKFVDDLARKVNRDPEDATFRMENGKVSVFSLSKKGIRLNQAESIKKIEEFLIKNNFFLSQNQTLNLSYTETNPKISINSIDSMGINSLIASGKSNFRGSTNSRIHNIKVAASRFNGLLIKPGEEFSFVKHLGEVDGEHGYLPELVIKKNKTEPEFGGGICQVSTTTFRAAINSGLKITARRNHAYPVAYYNPQGMDATIYIPRPDLRFINNTPGYILIQTEIKGTELIFNFYGTDDGRKIEIIGPKIIERNPDGSMKTTFTQKVLDKNENVMIEDVFNSNYDSPSKYPHPGETANLITVKPKNWSSNEWKKYKKEHGI
jgi:vancomycin resistance protein YoaR